MHKSKKKFHVPYSVAVGARSVSANLTIPMVPWSGCYPASGMNIQKEGWDCLPRVVTPKLENAALAHHFPLLNTFCFTPPASSFPNPGKKQTLTQIQEGKLVHHLQYWEISYYLYLQYCVLISWIRKYKGKAKKKKSYFYEDSLNQHDHMFSFSRKSS